MAMMLTMIPMSAAPVSTTSQAGTQDTTAMWCWTCRYGARGGELAVEVGGAADLGGRLVRDEACHLLGAGRDEALETEDPAGGEDRQDLQFAWQEREQRLQARHVETGEPGGGEQHQHPG